MEPHIELLTQIEVQYMMKNICYHNVSHVTFCRFGPVSYALRLTDKMSRYENLLTHPDIDGNDESIDDTLRDAINYVLMWAADIYVGSDDESNDDNVRKTTEYIRDLACNTYANLCEMGEDFKRQWLQDGKMLSDVPYEMYEQEVPLPHYIEFASYLVMLYVDRRKEED